MGKTLGYGEITVANMTEPFTVMLTNEAQQFATDSNRKVTSAQSYYTDIIVIRGSQERTDYTIGNITSGSGITVSKNNKRVTFSVNAGATIGADTGVVEIPITLDGQTVKKQFSWSCGKQGPQGVKGQDGTSIKITSKSVTYQTSTSGTTAPTGTWSTTVPTVNNGQYLWTKTTVQYSDGNKTEAYSVSYKGTNGTNGASVTVSKTEVTYQVSTSGTTAPTGTWSKTMPSCDQGQYLWTKTYVKYSDGKETTSYSVSYKGVDGEKFAFNMLRETNQGSKHWENHASGGKYSTESIITEDGINAVKLICTEAIPSGGWQYVSFDDYQMLKSLKPSTDYVISFDIKSNLGTQGPWVSIQQGDSTNAMLPAAITHIKGNETWEHIRVFLRSNDTLPKINGQYIYITSLGGVGYSIIKNLKLTESTTDTPWAPHPEDLEGRGVTEITQWYLATNLSSGVTAGTSGWSTDITTQKITADKKYLWNCHRTRYSDGTMTLISTPAIIGVYGDKGDNAKNLTITPSSQYFKSTDGGKTFAPDTITIKPTIQGEISFGKWQYSIDGGVSFVDVVSGQKGLTISNNVLTVSKDSSLYSDAVTMVTFRAVANDSSFYDTCSVAKIYDVSDIGDGRNLWITRDNITLQACEKDKYIYTTTGTSAVCIGADAASVGTNTIALQTGTKYTISFVISSPSEVGNALWYFCTALNSTGVKNYGGYGVKLVTGENIVSQTITVDTSCDAAGLVLYHLPTGCVIKDIQVEKGSSPTGWTPAPEDIQTAILSTKSEISDVSLKVDKNKQAIEQRVEKTTYQQDLNLVKGDINKANEGLNKWRYEIYPKSLFASEYQGKSTMDVFAKNTNLTPSQSVLINDTDFGKSWAYGDNYIGYALTFVKFSAAKSIAITFKHDDGAHLYLNGKLIGGDDTCNTGSGESLTLSFIQGWNCLEVVLNEKSGGEYIGLGTTISAISECQLMNCYYGTPVARQSHITNQLVENTTNIKGISTKVSKVTSVIGEDGKNFTDFKNDYSDFKQTMNGFKTTVGQTYVTKDDFNGLEIGGRNLVRLGGLSSNGATSFSYDKTTDIYTIVSPVVSTVCGIGAAVKYDDNHKVLIPYGKTYILSFEVKVPQALSINIDINNFAVSGSSWAGNDNDDGSMRGQSSYNIPANTWTKVWVKWANTNTKNTNKVDLYDNSSIGLVTKDCTSAITWQIRHVKGELGNKPTDWTPAPEDVNGKIVNVETIANQTAKKFEWIVKGGDNSSNFTLTDRVADLVAEKINFNGLVKFSGLAKSTQDKINSPTSGNLITVSPTNPTSNYSNTTFSIVSDDAGGRCIQTTAQFVPFTNYASNIFKPGEQIYYNINVPNWSSTTFDANLGIWFFTAEKKCVVNSCTRVTLQRTTWNRLSGYITVPTSGWSGIIYYVIGIENPNKYQLGLVSNSYIEKTNSYATTYSSNAVNWVTNNGSSTTSLNSMVKKWTDGAVSDTTQINGGWLKANTITASKIALADFTNYSQLTRDTAATYGFAVTDDTDGTWFSTQGIRRDQFISETFPCNGGESYLIEYDISTNAKGANNSTDTKNYIGVAIGVYGYTGTVGSNGLPNKATNIWYATRVTGSETAAVTHVKTTITTSTATKQFRIFLQSNGYYFEGTTKIRNLSVRRMYGGTLIVDGSITADKIATDAIKSRNYISSGGTQGSFLNLSDGSFTSPNLSWDSNGNLIAKNANLSGEITATNGSIAGWTIISNKMYTTGSGKYTGIGKYGSAYAFWAGATSNDNGNSAVFKVGHTGKLTATDADITGTITATNGKIGRYDITSTYLMTNSGSNASGIGGNQAFWAGAEDSNSAPFRVGYDGVLWAENAAIRGSIETGNLGDEGDTVSIINGHIGIQGTSNNVEIYSTGFKFGIDGDYYLMSVSEGVKCYRNLYATDFVADGWLYCSEVHSSGAVVIGADSESFYWAHGYQIARGTSWGGVCVGDDSQQLRLYGSSIWASHSISTSDENLKENFTTLDQYEDFYMNLNPIGFNYIGDYDGKKTHFGFGAHKTEDILESEGYDSDKFAVVTHRPLVQEDIEKRFGKDVEVDIETEYGVSYTEFIALNTHMIQKTRRELTKVKQEKADLEARLQAIEAKLGL
nr:MAG TPA: tail protein [Caudoviricetes sp.]